MEEDESDGEGCKRMKVGRIEEDESGWKWGGWKRMKVDGSGEDGRGYKGIREKCKRMEEEGELEGNTFCIWL